MDNPAGYIKLYRQITEWEHYKDPLLKGVFIHILLKAHYADRNDSVSGTLRTTMKDISNETGYSYGSVRTALAELTLTGEISVCRAFRGITIQIHKWNEFQAKTSFKEVKKEKNKTEKINTDFKDRGF